MANFCTYCGSQLDDGANFCNVCGKKTPQEGAQGGVTGVVKGSTRSGGKKWVIIPIVVFGLIFITVAGVFGVRMAGKLATGFRDSSSETVSDNRNKTDNNSSNNNIAKNNDNTPSKNTTDTNNETNTVIDAGGIEDNVGDDIEDSIEAGINIGDGYSQETAPFAETESPVVATKAYYNEAEGFSFFYPENWVTMDSDEDEIVIGMMDAVTGTNINVGVTLDDGFIDKATVEDFAGIFAPYETEVLDWSPVNINGYTGKKLSCMLTNEAGEHLRMLQYYYASDGQIFIITCASLESIVDESTPIFDRIISSYTVSSPYDALMYDDEFFNSYFSWISIPDFYPFTSDEARGINSDWSNCSIIDDADGFGYFYDSWSEDAYNRYNALLEKLGYAVVYSAEGEDYRSNGYTTVLTQKVVEDGIGIGTYVSIGYDYSTGGYGGYGDYYDGYGDYYDNNTEEYCYTIGDTVYIDGFEVTMVSAEIRYDDYGLGTECIVFNFEVHNGLNSEKYISGFDFNLSDANGYMMISSYMIKNSLSANIMPGKKASGEIAFEYTDSPYYDLYYSYDIFSNPIWFRVYNGI